MKKTATILALSCLALLFGACGAEKETAANATEQGSQTTQEAKTSQENQATKREIPPPPQQAPDTAAATQKYPIRKESNKIVTLETSYGKLIVELYRDVAPAHADSFAARVADHFYDSTMFHRIIDGFVIQGGDPTNTGAGGAGYTLPAEFSDLPHQEGTLSMARSQDVNSASSQFFVCLGRVASLDKQYTIFGQLLSGYDVLHKLGSVPTDPNPNMGGEMSKPRQPVYLVRAYLSDAAGNPLTK